MKEGTLGRRGVIMPARKTSQNKGLLIPMLSGFGLKKRSFGQLEHILGNPVDTRFEDSAVRVNVDLEG